MNIVIPMAGRGQRFVDAGYATPKPLIPLHGRPMFTWAVESLPLHLADRIVFVCLASHLNDWPLREEIERRYAAFNPAIVTVDGVTEGQACTVLLAREHINNDKPLLIHNGDTMFRSPLANTIETADADVAGIITVFKGEGDHWSFARTDDQGNVIEVAEKRRISPWATVGMYHFARGCDFVRLAETMIARNERVGREFYVGPLYSHLIAHGGRVILDHADEVWCTGTPAEFEHFKAHYKLQP